MILYEAIKAREPFFIGWDTAKVTYVTSCPHCKVKLSVDFKEMLDAEWGIESRMDEELKESLAEKFKINKKAIHPT